MVMPKFRRLSSVLADKSVFLSKLTLAICRRLSGSVVGSLKSNSCICRMKSVELELWKSRSETTLLRSYTYDDCSQCCWLANRDMGGCGRTTVGVPVEW